MLLLGTILAVFSFSTFIFFFNRNQEYKNTEIENEEKEEKKNLTSADKLGIIHLIFLALVLAVDLIETFKGNFLYSEYRGLYELAFNIEFVSMFILIPLFFITVLVKLIRSLKQEKHGGIIASISLILNVVMGLVNAGTYAAHF